MCIRDSAYLSHPLYKGEVKAGIQLAGISHDRVCDAHRAAFAVCLKHGKNYVDLTDRAKIASVDRIKIKIFFFPVSQDPI